MSRRPRSFLLVGIVAAPLAGCAGGVLDPQGPIGAANAKILLNALGIMLVIVVPTILATLWFAFWFRASNTRASYWPTWVYSGRIELLVWGLPLLVIMFVGGLIWIGSHELDPFRPIGSEKEASEVEVISLDWKWLFIYPDQRVASVNQVVVPAGMPVHFSITSASVMNMFFIPQLGSMIAAMNGMVTQVHLKAAQPGEYYGQSAQISGDGFSDMRFILRAVDSGEFQRWVTVVQQDGPALDRAAYSSLSRQSGNVAPFTYRSEEADLFRAVVTHEVPPGPGPKTGRGGVAVHPREEP